ncbi:hypothetical protein CFC21_019583 [Triticum aestivum]|uniref:Uncharacterized protein n=2 Tax=Triticum aestivum TaxID=4565 RepID=A0A3B6B799_WHEAT|nr:hypothetical protein CFC21_019583 [Triticum aestivum]
MGIHLLAFAGARMLVQVFQVSAPLLWPLNLWLPLARRLPEACAVARAALAAHVSWLRRACRPGAPVWSRRDDGVYRRAVLDVAYY